MRNINYNSQVFYTGHGRHFHVFDDCRGLWQGRTNSMKHGLELQGESDLTYQEAIYMGLYGCSFCHKRLGVEVPAEASLKVARAKRAAERAAKQAAKLAPVVTVVEPVIVEPIATPVTTDVDKLIADIYAMLAQIESLVA
jgi:hypothetical protein